MLPWRRRPISTLDQLIRSVPARKQAALQSAIRLRRNTRDELAQQEAGKIRTAAAAQRTLGNSETLHKLVAIHCEIGTTKAEEIIADCFAAGVQKPELITAYVAEDYSCFIADSLADGLKSITSRPEIDRAVAAAQQKGARLADVVVVQLLQHETKSGTHLQRLVQKANDHPFRARVILGFLLASTLATAVNAIRIAWQPLKSFATSLWQLIIAS